MDDFLSNTGRTEDFLRKMITRAQEEVGFKVQGGPMTIQVAVLAENTLALTFSEKQGGNFLELLEGLRAAMNSLSNAVNEKAEAQANETSASDKSTFLLEFDDLDALRAFCVGLPDDLEDGLSMDSELYCMEEEKTYCLILHRGQLDEKGVCRIMSASVEFMDELSVEETQVAYIREHGTCVLKKHAIAQLQSLFRH
jgi:negative regulator of genetic competence, sporulation and motility